MSWEIGAVSLVSVRMIFRGNFLIFNGRGLHCQLKNFYLVTIFGLRNPSSVEEVLNSLLAIPPCGAIRTLRLLLSVIKPSVISLLSHGGVIICLRDPHGLIGFSTLLFSHI
jgi:hypothetical protein